MTKQTVITKLSILLTSLAVFVVLFPGRAAAITCADGSTLPEARASECPAASASGPAFDLFNEACKNVAVADAATCTDSKVGQTSASNQLFGPDGVLTKGAGILSIAVGLASVIMIMFGGLKYINSGGEASKAASAKNTIVYAVLGLLTALFAQAIIIFVLDKL